MVYCGRCGQQNPDDSRFCARCANPLTPPPPPQPQYQPPTPPYVPYAPPKKDNNTLIIVVVVLIAIMVIAGVYGAWLVFHEIEDFTDNEVTITITSYVGVTVELDLFLKGDLVDSITLAPGATYENTFPYDPSSSMDPDNPEVVVIRYEGNSIYNTYVGTIWLGQDAKFACGISIYD